LKLKAARPDLSAPETPKAEKHAESSPATAPSPGTFRDASRPGDPEDAELERRIVAAELAGRTIVADALAMELKARRAARAAGNVVTLGVMRSKKTST
jgi:hypothetical protein